MARRRRLFPRRMELIPKDMLLGGEEGLRAWIASTWYPFIQKIPESLKQEFISKLVEHYIKSHPRMPKELSMSGW
ncbi:hypothetical protein MSMTP_1074 [Methanosarcina sp. MTP4]|uniref:hypothetical protein n=1 Tax=Methanosarcina sp. MTP4 TaxID=1434100 RepID=UPI000615F479|nr:hypothetical protein [Methanosarcina sp. MTP4]AKB24543.1 hypothetical protein MSMTP_1074 [Methanosarcina sp. MTP4]